MKKSTNFANTKYVVGSQILRMRELKKLTQKELAKILGVSENTIANYENGITKVPTHIIRNCHHIFQLPYDFFIDGIEYSIWNSECCKKCQNMTPARRDCVAHVINELPHE